MACRGFCRACGREHRLHVNGALRHGLQLMELLRTRRSLDLDGAATAPDRRLSTDWLYGEARGKMFGVLECLAPDGSTRILRAFSGQYNGLWEIDGWAPPLFDSRQLAAISAEVEREIKELGAELAHIDDPDLRRTLRRRRRQLSQDLMRRIHGLYRLTNFHGREASLFAACGGHAIPTGTGDCCAPKLLGLAARSNLAPLGLAEFFWGRSNRSGTREEGRFYPSCEEKCAPILGFLLCGLEARHAGPAA
ncbi:hypothetical protein JWG42_10860 [Desulfoprunum benzoelyticum]|nr:hypothetical protein [Desulfoprunum benzoelyticum]